MTSKKMARAVIMQSPLTDYKKKLDDKIQQCS